MNTRILSFTMLFLITASYTFGEEEHQEAGHMSHSFSPYLIVLLIIILAVLVVFLYMRYSSKTQGMIPEDKDIKDPVPNLLTGSHPKHYEIKPEELNEMSRTILAERFAKGEVPQSVYDAILYELNLLEDEFWEANKLKLVKGEISFIEYDELTSK